MFTNQTLHQLFRQTATYEGYSYLVLLGVAMPVKYWLNWPIAVSIVGMAHGILFTAFVGLLGLYKLRVNWSWKNTIWAFVLSLIPFGTFYLTTKMLPPIPHSQPRN